MRGSEFIRRIQKLGRERGVPVEWRPERGKGSHGLLHFGSRITVVRNPKDELDKGAFYGMLRQLGLNREELE